MKLSLLFLILIPATLWSQLSFDRSIKKLGIEKENVVYTIEKILLYPRSFIYNLEKSDSIAYFGCISTDRKHFTQYFENRKEALKMSVGSNLLRGSGEYIDTMQIESIDVKSRRFKYSNPSKKFELEKGVQYVIICYWSTQTLDRSIIKNYLYFSEYLENHPEIKAQLIPVCADPL
jgi:hypothetical protein